MLVVQNAEGLEGGSALAVQVGHVELEREAGGVGRSESEAAAGKIRLDFGAQRNDADVADDDGTTELDQVQIWSGCQSCGIVGESIEKDEFYGALVHHFERERRERTAHSLSLVEAQCNANKCTAVRSMCRVSSLITVQLVVKRNQKV